VSLLHATCLDQDRYQQAELNKTQMKKQLFTLIIILVSLLTFAQEKLEPTILILSPNETKFDK